MCSGNSLPFLARDHLSLIQGTHNLFSVVTQVRLVSIITNLFEFGKNIAVTDDNDIMVLVVY